MQVQPENTGETSKHRPIRRIISGVSDTSEEPIRYLVVVGRQRERAGVFPTRNDALALVRELTASYGLAALAELTLELQVGGRAPVVLGHGAELIDMASAIHSAPDSSSSPLAGDDHAQS